MRYLTGLLALLCLVGPVAAQGEPPAGNYPTDAERLCILARDLWAPVELAELGYTPPSQDARATEKRMRQACMFLEAAVRMDDQYDIAWHDLLTLYASAAINDPGRSAERLVTYTSRNVHDNEPVVSWLRYMLDYLPNLTARKNFLRSNINALQSYPAVRSDALTELGHIALEQEDLPTTRYYFEQAIAAWRYHERPVADYLTLPPWDAPATEVTAMSQEQVAAAKRGAESKFRWYTLLRWRLRLRCNPFDLAATVKLIEALDELGLHEQAQRYYPHAYDLLDMQQDPAEWAEVARQLRRGQLISAFSLARYQECIPIAEKALHDDPDSYVVNALMGKCLTQVGMTSDAERFLGRAAQLANTAIVDIPGMGDLGWFYCFIDTRPAEALNYAQQDLELRGDDPLAQATFAYALLLQGEIDQAAEVLETVDPNGVVAALALAKVAADRGDPILALRYLRSVPRRNRHVLAGDVAAMDEELRLTAREDHDLMADLLPEDGRLLMPPRNVLAQRYVSAFDDQELGVIKAPDKTIHCSMALTKRTDVFSYGEAIVAELFLSNQSETEVPVGPGTMIDPHFLIVAEVTPVTGVAAGTAARHAPPSDQTQVFPIAHRYLLQDYVLPRGRRNKTADMLNVGPLRDMLEDHPQQAYRVTFRGFLDPVADGADGFRGRMSAIQPQPATIMRKAFIPTDKHMSLQYNLMQNGTSEERVRAAHLLGGLLREALLARQGQLTYNLQRIDEGTIRKLLAENLAHADFRVRAWSAYTLRGLPISPDSLEAQHLGQLLGDEHWFVRFMAAQTLEPVAEMDEYYRWATAIERNELVLRQAQFMQGQPWQIIDVPVAAEEPNAVIPVEEEWSVDDLF